jgi:hypothetical protein
MRTLHDNQLLMRATADFTSSQIELCAVSEAHMTVKGTALIPPLSTSSTSPLDSYYQSELPLKLQKARQLGYEVRVVRVDCNRKDCKRCTAKADRRRSRIDSRIISLEKATQHWQQAKLITLTACSELKVSSELVRSLNKKNLLDTSEFIASIEAGENGEVHVHVLIHSTCPDDAISKGIQTWMKRSKQNVKGHFDLTSYDHVQTGVSYVCKNRTPREFLESLPKRKFTCSRNLTQRRVPSKKPTKNISGISAPPPKKTKQSGTPCGQQAALRISKKGNRFPSVPDSPIPISYDEIGYSFRHFQSEATRLSRYELDYAIESFVLSDSQISLIVQTMLLREYKYIAPSEVIPPVVLRAMQFLGLALASSISASENNLLDGVHSHLYQSGTTTKATAV